MVRSSVIGFAVLVLGSCLGTAGGDKSKSPVKVDVEWDKEDRVDAVDVEGELDMTPRLQLRPIGANFSVMLTDDTNKRLDLGHLVAFKIDGKVVAPSSVLTKDGRTDIIKKDTLPKKGGKERVGYSKVWKNGDLQITQTVELVPGRTTGEVRKRQMDAVLIRHTIENKGKAAHSVGMRTLIDQRSGKVTSATKPGTALDGVEFKGGALPPYLKVQQVDGKKAKVKLAIAAEAYITLAAAGGERPDRLVVSGGPRTDPWELPVMAGGPLPAVALFFEPKEIAPGGKRELVYGYGTSVASSSGGDVSFRLELGGSFELGKTFTLSALIADPSPGQSLELDLPKGLELREGKAIQPVPTALGETSGSVILWKARVLEFGRFPIRIRSGAGVTRTLTVTVGPA